MSPKKKNALIPKNTEEKPKKTIKQKSPQLLKGMKDILPADQRYWQAILKACRRIASSHMFEWIETPVLESTALYQRTTGKTSDIVKKEMFTFVDQGNESVTLRPEFTPGIARAYVEHGMLNLPQPVKLFSYGPLFRHDKPQAGRYRQFTQLNFEIFGDAAPAVDAELIAMQYFILFDVGLESIIHVNSIGCPNCRPQYKQLIIDYFKSKRKNLCEDCKDRLTKNPLRILDCKEEVCREIAAEAPQTVDYLCEECKEHFMKVLEHLDDADIPYALDPKIVRGLDYYTKTTFEAFLIEKGEEKIGRQTALGAGGRYDGLIESLGGRAETPG
ncbi:histidine--tRNA ligase, partial [Patescibacteria group bacterium]|nr:histidine--tRNA ligase [Patescibacteria group bacterium]